MRPGLLGPTRETVAFVECEADTVDAPEVVAGQVVTDQELERGIFGHAVTQDISAHPSDRAS